MAFTQQGTFTFLHSNQPDNLSGIMSAAQIKSSFDSQANELKTTLNKLIVDLGSTTASNGGSRNIGSETISGVAGLTVYAQLTDLKAQADTKLAKTGGTMTGQLTMQADIVGTGYTVDVSSLREDGVRVNQTYAKLTGATFTGLVTGTTINATTLQEGGTALTSKYAQLGVANTFTTSQTISSGGLSTNEGILSAGSVANNGRVRIAHTSTINYIQSGQESGGSTAKNLTISGYGATTLSEVNIATNTLKIAGQPIQSGSVSITPVASTPTKVTVTFPTPYTSPPHVVATGESAVVGSQLQGVSVANITNTTVDIYIYRTNTNATTVHWIAMI
jgi:hypothetical protein